MGEGRRPGAPAQVQVQPGRPVVDLPGRDASLQQVGIKQLPQDRQALLIAAAQDLQVLALGPLGIQLVPQLAQYLGQFGGVDGLEDILRHVHADGLLGIFKVVKAGEHHELGGRQPLGQDAAQLQAVHEGHLDIGEHHVGPELLGQLQRVLAVFRLPHQGEAQSRPVHFPADAHPDILLVVHQEHTIGVHGRFLLFHLTCSIPQAVKRYKGRASVGCAPFCRSEGLFLDQVFAHVQRAGKQDDAALDEVL